MHKAQPTNTVTIPPEGLLHGELWGEWPKCREIAGLFSREGRALSARVLRAYNNGYEVKMCSPALQLDDMPRCPKIKQAARYEAQAIILLLKAQDMRKEADRKRLWAELKSDSHAERMAINEMIYTDERKARIAFAEELYYATMPGTAGDSSADAREEADEKKERTKSEHAHALKGQNVKRTEGSQGNPKGSRSRQGQDAEGGRSPGTDVPHTPTRPEGAQEKTNENSATERKRTNIEHSTSNVQHRMNGNGNELTKSEHAAALKGQNVLAQGQDAEGGRSPGTDVPHTPTHPEGAQERTNENSATERKRTNIQEKEHCDFSKGTRRVPNVPTSNVQHRMDGNGNERTKSEHAAALKGQNVLAQGQDAEGGRNPGEDVPHTSPRPEGAQEETNENSATERKRNGNGRTSNIQHPTSNIE
jgi:hypothetical protein